MIVLIEVDLFCKGKNYFIEKNKFFIFFVIFYFIGFGCKLFVFIVICIRKEYLVFNMIFI